MNKEFISDRQGISILIMFTLGTTLIINPWKTAGSDSWISIIIAMIIMIPTAIMYTRLVSIFPDKNLFDLQQELFGNILGKLTTFFIVWISMLFNTLAIRHIAEFIQVLNFPETPLSVSAMIFGVLNIWIVKQGIEVIGRWSAFMLPIVVILIIVVSMLLIPKMVFNNILPVLYNGLTPVLNGAAYTFIVPFAETFLFTIVFSSLKNKNRIFKIYLWDILICGCFFILTTIRNISTLGEYLNSSLYYPSYLAIGLVNIMDFIDRIEVVVGGTFIIMAFVKISVFLYSACVGIAKIFNIKDYRQIVAPIGLMTILMSVFVFNNTMEIFEWAAENSLYFILPPSIILPLLTLIAAEIKIHSRKYNDKLK